jgi:hypothetical protein
MMGFRLDEQTRAIMAPRVQNMKDGPYNPL